jgi:hypothetical protein
VSNGKKPRRVTESGLQSSFWSHNLFRMASPTGPVTLTVHQIEELHKKLSALRHDVNNHLSLIVAAAELIKFNPESAARMCATLGDQPPKISEEISKFSAEFEKAMGITRG